MRRSKAQSSIEYFIIAVMVLLFMVPIWLYVTNTQSQTVDELSLAYSQNAVKQFSDVASTIADNFNINDGNIIVYDFDAH